MLLVMRSTSAIEVRPSRTLQQPVVAQPAHAFRDGDRDHVVDGGALEDQRADRAR